MSDSIGGRSRNKTWILPALLVTSAVYLYANLFALPNIPYLLGGDQIFFWVYAQRMLAGEHIYQDFFDFKPPGTNLVYVMLFKLFGIHIWVTNLAVLLLGAILCCLCFSIARRVMRIDLAVLAALFFLVCIYGRLMNATHHWFSLLGVMCAVRVVMPGRTFPRIACAGVSLASASCFTQTAGVFGLLALLLSLVWDGVLGEGWRAVLQKQFLLAATFALSLLALNIPLIASIGWRQLWYFEVVYPQYLVYWFGKWFPGLPEPLGWHNLHRLAPYLFFYVLLPIIYPAVLWYCWRNRNNRELPSADLVLLSFSGLFLILEILPGVNWLRVFCVSMPGIILLVWTVTHPSRWQRHAAMFGWMAIVAVAFASTLSRHAHGQVAITFPAGKAIVSAKKADKFLWLLQHTKPGDLLFQPAWPEAYIPFELRNPTFADSLIPNGMTRPDLVDITVKQLDQRQVKYVVWAPELNTPDDPARPLEYYLGPMRSYLTSHYTRVEVFADGDEVWRRD